MGNVLTPSLAVRRHHKLTKLRELPIKGDLCVKVGDIVEPHTIIGRAELPGFLSVLRVCEALECSPEIVSKELKRHGHTVGNQIKTGDLVAQVAGIFGLFKREFRSSVTGIIEYIAENSGHIGVRGSPDIVTLSAFVKGEVVAIEPNKSVLIQLHGSYVQGAFGVGGERRGTLRGLNIPSDRLIDHSIIPENCSGAVLYGGSGVTTEALKIAATRGAVGIITGAIADQVLKDYVGQEIGVAVTGDEQVPLSVIVTEGFGNIPMSQAVSEVLHDCEGLPVGISGVTQVRAGAVRPEIICERPGKDDLQKTPVLEIGSRVRLIRVPYFGQFGTISALPKDLQLLPTGSSARVAEVKLDSGGIVRIPRANIEIQI